MCLKCSQYHQESWIKATSINYSGNIKNKFFHGKLAIEQIQASTSKYEAYLFFVTEMKSDKIC